MHTWKSSGAFATAQTYTTLLLVTSVSGVHTKLVMRSWGAVLSLAILSSFLLAFMLRPSLDLGQASCAADAFCDDTCGTNPGTCLDNLKFCCTPGRQLPCNGQGTFSRAAVAQYVCGAQNPSCQGCRGQKVECETCLGAANITCPGDVGQCLQRFPSDKAQPQRDITDVLYKLNAGVQQNDASMLIHIIDSPTLTDAQLAEMVDNGTYDISAPCINSCGPRAYEQTPCFFACPSGPDIEVKRLSTSFSSLDIQAADPGTEWLFSFSDKPGILFWDTKLGQPSALVQHLCSWPVDAATDDRYYCGCGPSSDDARAGAAQSPDVCNYTEARQQNWKKSSAEYVQTMENVTWENNDTAFYFPCEDFLEPLDHSQFGDVMANYWSWDASKYKGTYSPWVLCNTKSPATISNVTYNEVLVEAWTQQSLLELDSIFMAIVVYGERGTPMYQKRLNEALSFQAQYAKASNNGFKPIVEVDSVVPPAGGTAFRCPPLEPIVR